MKITPRSLTGWPVTQPWAYDLSAFSQRVLEARNGGDLNRALTLIIDFVVNICSRDAAAARVFSSKELDELCQRLGQLGEPPERSLPGETVVFVVTGLYERGGHTRMLRDIVACEEQKKVVILCTNTLHDLDIGDLQEAIGASAATLEVSPVGDHATTLVWLQNRLRELRPRRTYLLQHHYDAPAIAAVQPGLCGDLYFSHHGDHNLTLGVHLPHARHIDHTAKNFYQCREIEGVFENVLWPIVAPDPGAPEFRRIFRSEGPTTCCCGGFEKFELPHLIEPIAYQISYADVVVRTLQATRGRHLHIGHLSESLLEEIRASLRRHKIDDQAFVQIEFAPSLIDAFQDQNVDIYMGSMPRGGGRAAVEAMAAGLPMLVHANYRTVFFSSENEVYPEALVWRTLAELETHLRSMDSDMLRIHAAKSRQFYEMNNSPSALRKAMSTTFSGDAMPLPTRPTQRPNSLQAFLDERAIYAQFRSPGAAHRVHSSLQYMSTFQLIRVVFDRLLSKLKRRNVKKS